MEITLKNCNNIKEGKITVIEKAVNIKYGFNGTGKSTIAKALKYQFDGKSLDFFKPYTSKNEEASMVQINPPVSYRIALFNEEYIDSFVFKSNELITNSFEIFVKDKDYENNLKAIEALIKDIRAEFNDNEKLIQLISVLQEFLESFGKATSKIAASGPLAKGLGNGNQVENIPKELAGYAPFIQQKENVKYIGWQANGVDYLNVADACPFCAQHLDEDGTVSKATVRKVSEKYNSNNIKHLNTVLDIFEKLSEYFADTTKSIIMSFCKRSDKIDSQNTNYLLGIRQEAINLLESLRKISALGFHQLKDVDNIMDTLSSLQIKLELLAHFNGSALTSSIIQEINQKLNLLIENANRLKGIVNIQKAKIRETIQEHENEINGFLSNAGFKYSVRIKGEDQEKILLYPLDGTENVENVIDHLSYGEKNSLALVLFAFQAEHENADFIILDDPISSFDGNKKFAIIHLLFMKNGRRKCKFSNKTILFLTHDFGSVIDMQYSIRRALSCDVQSAYLYCNDKGFLTETLIQQDSIISCIEATRKIFNCNDYHIACRLSALRRNTELVEGKNRRWHYLSSILHNEEPGILFENNLRKPFSSIEISEIECDISAFITDYTHSRTIALFQDKEGLISAYNSSNNAYEKLQLFRVVQGNKGTENSIVNKFINETFHVENDYLFQLDPCVFELVPEYILAECNQAIMVDSCKV